MLTTEEEPCFIRGSSAGTEPLAAPINEACRIAGMSRSELYRRLAAGDIVAVKNGSRTLVLIDSIRAYLNSLPVATFRTPKAAS